MENWKKEMVFLKGFAKGKGYNNLLKAIHCAEIAHQNDTRGGGLPYLSHPIRIANAHLSLGLDSDPICEDVLAVDMLHDVPEDHPEMTDEMMVFDFGIDPAIVRHAQVLNKSNYPTTAAYYKAIFDNGIVTILAKMGDRCHNVSTMAGVFSVAKIEKYIIETEEYVIPMCRNAVRRYPEYANLLYTMRYHVESIIAACRVIVEVKRRDEVSA